MTEVLTDSLDSTPLNRQLLGVNFFAGDVTAGFGPYLAISTVAKFRLDEENAL
ncbi:hypothetical protein [Ruegeria sp. SCP11]|uniref:hypothetical protein n=1 Tax=Ruegeria sp. SCP11 TaxID=3141378 RepID=UPI003335EF7B